VAQVGADVAIIGTAGARYGEKTLEGIPATAERTQIHAINDGGIGQSKTSTRQARRSDASGGVTQVSQVVGQQIHSHPGGDRLADDQNLLPQS